MTEISGVIEGQQSESLAPPLKFFKGQNYNFAPPSDNLIIQIIEP